MTATILKTNNAPAAALAAIPKTSSTGNTSSAAIARYAAISNGIIGTAYSYSNKYMVELRFEIFVNPDFQKTLATQIRRTRSPMGAPQSSRHKILWQKFPSVVSLNIIFRCFNLCQSNHRCQSKHRKLLRWRIACAVQFRDYRQNYCRLYRLTSNPKDSSACSSPISETIPFPD